jgi:hypothetical protein
VKALHSPSLYSSATRRALGAVHRSNALAQEKTGEFGRVGLEFDAANQPLPVCFRFRVRLRGDSAIFPSISFFGTAISAFITRSNRGKDECELGWASFGSFTMLPV